MRRSRALIAIGLASVVGSTAAAEAARPAPDEPPRGVHAAGPGKGKGKKKPRPPRSFPWNARVRDAAAFARGRAGGVSFAVVDERGRIHGWHRGIRYSSASLVKAMLLVAYLNRGNVKRRGLRASDRRLLGPMIRVSDNDAASAVYSQVGPGGLRRLARRARMRRFIASPVWGGCQLTARDQARFFARIDRLLPRRHRKYALGLLRRIVPAQRWGIPRGLPRGWHAHFKGGWFPSGDGWRVHQGALLRRGGRHLGLAVLTSGDPSLEYGADTIRGVTARLLRGYRAR
jgi:Beta-lactamase enzyme family